MARWDISGTWVGEYWYDPAGWVTDLPPPVSFTLTARVGWFGRVRGTVEDDSAVVARGEATIAGWVAGRSVRFKKRYRTCCVARAGRYLPFPKYMEQEHGIPVDKDVPASPILYRGEYDPMAGTAAGTWQIPASQTTFFSRGEIRMVQWPAAQGGWRMRREFG